MSDAPDAGTAVRPQALTLRSEWKRPIAVGTWPLPGEPAFAESPAFLTLRRELRRYLLEEVSGRSFLIAGHRGAGKTALVTQAVRQLRTEMIQASVNPEAARLGRRVRLQRPLLVKLVGKSLIAPPPPGSENGREASGASAASGAAGQTAPVPATGSGTAPGTSASAAGAQAPAPAAAGAAAGQGAASDSQAASALVHITIALYRALAHDLAEGFAIHAREARADRADLTEVAAQLALDLDNAPDPALLRRRWNQLGRLTAGVLWPGEADRALRENSLVDQGLREIVAAATAAQAFQVCLGTITDQTTSSAAASAKQDFTGSADLKDVISRLGAVFAGTAAGGVAASTTGGVPALGIGLLVWLASSAALSWKSSRSRSRDQSVSYTFMRDRSVQTLDRDLPLVIERIRDAGLAPVFVIDELDKLEDANATIKAILDRLKHLMADHGFFCFLTDRAYFDDIERLVAAEAYPVEHTYFSQRLLALIGPLELFDYVTGLFAQERDAADDLALATFALASIFRSKLNFTDLSRELSRQVDDQGALRIPPEQLRRRTDLRLAATLQLACDEVLRRDRYAARFQSDPAFAQLAVDTLYYIARAWEETATNEVDLSDGALEAYLINRSIGRHKPDPASPSGSAAPSGAASTAGAPDGQPTPRPAGNGGAAASHGTNGAEVARISPADLRMAAELLRAQTKLLANFEVLVEAVRARPNLDKWRFADIVPRETGQKGLICAAAPDRPFVYRFVLDETGMPYDLHDRQQWLDGAKQQEVSALSRLLAAFEQLISTLGLTPGQLVTAGLLPATLTATALAVARRTLEDVDRLLIADEDLADALVTARQLRQSLQDNAAELRGWFYIVEELVKRGLPEDLSSGDLLNRLSRYLSVPDGTADRGRAARLLQAIRPQAPELDLTTAEGLTALSRGFQGTRAEAHAVALDARTVDTLWSRWRERVSSWFAGSPTSEPIGFDDLQSAVTGVGPGPFFRADLSAMTIRDWSRLALAASPDTKGPDMPAWPFVAALRALGFGNPALADLARELAGTAGFLQTPADREMFELTAAGAPLRVPGYLLAEAPDATIPAIDGAPGDLPLLALAAEDMSDYTATLDRMTAAGLIEGVLDAVS